MGKSWKGIYPRLHDKRDKYTKKTIEKLCLEAINYVKNNKNILYFVEIEVYLMEKFEIPCDNLENIFQRAHKQYNKYSIIQKTKQEIMKILEMRLLKDKDVRYNVQNLVLGTKYKYGERKSVENTHDFKNMPTVKIKGKEKEIDVGDE